MSPSDAPGRRPAAASAAASTIAARSGVRRGSIAAGAYRVPPESFAEGSRSRGPRLQGERSVEMNWAGITAGPRAPVRVALAVCAALAFLLAGSAVAGAADVTTGGYNNLRDDWDS